jgi:outer membrane protein assembly factor BamB
MYGRNLAWACLAATLGCQGPAGSVQSLSVEIAVTPTTLDFGPVYVQASATQTLAVANQGTAPESATVTISSSAFSAVGGPSYALPPGSTTTIPIIFDPTVPAVDQATAHVAWDEGSVDVTLSGIGHAWPDCTPNAQCEASTFDPQSGACVTSQLSDGALCDGGPSSCLQDSRCQAGQCVGEPLSCNDDNACTTDSCVEGQGCVHQEQTCTGTDPCQVYSCDPTKGCTSNNAPNGTLCSNNESCQTADICIEGKCVGTPVPNGFPCVLWWAPCATDAECQKGTCESPTASAEKPGDLRWTWQPDAGNLPAAIDVPAVDELGNSYVCGSTQTGGWESAAMDLVSLDQCGLQRWENPDFRGVTSLLLAGQELIFVDPTTNEVVALYRDTGQPLWQLSLIPSLVGSPDGGTPDDCFQIQISALALSPTGPIYAAGNLTNLCESGAGLPQPFLAGILPNGTLAWASLLAQSFAQPFGPGLMVDGQGNSYVSVIFSDSLTTEPALASFDPQGQPRFVAPLASQSPVLALGTDRIVEAVAGEVWNLDGGDLAALDAGSVGIPTNSVAIDGRDTVYLFGDGDGYYGASLSAFAAGEPDALWTLDLPGEIGSSNLVLGLGELFFAQLESCEGCPVGTSQGIGPQALTAVASTSGTQLWTTPLATGAYPYPAGTMTLSNTATLIFAYGGQVNAFFAGQQAPPDDAPWSRVGGSYSNQSSSAPPAQPSLPSGGSTPQGFRR